MKKMLFCLLAVIMLCSVSNASDFEDNKKDSPELSTSKQQEKRCEKCTIDDDEYCIYNQCFFDRQYRKMKILLCLSSEQENLIDDIYKNFKSDLETQCNIYKNEKNKLLDLIECDYECWKKQAEAVKKIKKDIKEKYKDFIDDTKEHLCTNQKMKLKKFEHYEKNKIKKLIKYAAIYKFPCIDCSN